MARGRKVTPIAPMEIKIGAMTLTISKDLSRQIAGIRDKVADFAKSYGVVTLKKADLVEPFIDAFTLWKRETSRTFVDFCRAVDPEIPADRDGYRNHPSYQAMEYLRRSFNNGGQGGGGRRTAPTRTNAVGRMARLLATILAVTAEETHAELWRSVGDELSLTPGQVTNLQKVVASTEPLFSLPIKKKLHAKVIHMEQPAQAAAA